MKRTTKKAAARFARRTAALFLATITVWALALTADVEAAGAALRSLGESPAFVAAVLRAELGEQTVGTEGSVDKLTFWQRLALSQAPTLLAGEDAVDALRNGDNILLPESPAPVEPDDPEDTHEIPGTASSENIIEKTLVPAGTEGYAYGDGVYLYNRTKQEVDIAAMASANVNIELKDDGPEILIMHTHGSEAYAQDSNNPYKETDTARTTDERFNMIRVGDEIATVFTELGFSVLHDRSLYDYPEYSGSYDRSKAAVEKYLAEYPTIKIVLDVHRDALIGSDGTVYKAVSAVDGKKAAQVLLVVGSNDGGLEHPKWRENLTLAVQIQKSMNSLYPTLARPITLRTSRFNQQLTTGSLLVEIGCHGNTLDEALLGAACFARAAGQVLLEMK